MINIESNVLRCSECNNFLNLDTEEVILFSKINSTGIFLHTCHECGKKEKIKIKYIYATLEKCNVRK